MITNILSIGGEDFKSPPRRLIHKGLLAAFTTFACFACHDSDSLASGHLLQRGSSHTLFPLRGINGGSCDHASFYVRTYVPPLTARIVTATTSGVIFNPSGAICQAGRTFVPFQGFRGCPRLVSLGCNARSAFFCHLAHLFEFWLCPLRGCSHLLSLLFFFQLLESVFEQLFHWGFQ